MIGLQKGIYYCKNECLELILDLDREYNSNNIVTIKKLVFDSSTIVSNLLLSKLSASKLKLEEVVFREDYDRQSGNNIQLMTLMLKLSDTISIEGIDYLEK